MAKQITLVVPDEFEQCLGAFLDAQVVQEPDPDTKAPIRRRMFADEEAWAEKVICDALAVIARQYPTDAVRQMIVQRDALTREIEQASRPSAMRTVRA
jgi:hypothetical protein